MAINFLRGCGNIDGNKSASPTDRDLAELYETFLGAAITDEILSLVAYIAYFPGHISMVLHNHSAYRIPFDSSPLTPASAEKPYECFDEAQHERKISNDFRSSSVRPEALEG
jgi:hypothetical protein